MLLDKFSSRSIDNQTSLNYNIEEVQLLFYYMGRRDFCQEGFEKKRS